MGVEPPFMYDKPSSYTFGAPTHQPFNPKAATHKSWTPIPQRPRADGPLIDFNKHPDSYLIVPYGNLNVQPMHPKTKVRVRRTRKWQLFFRSLALLGAAGLLFCVIAINKTTSSVGWLIRVGPAVALCHCVYAICHLGRDVASRPPASSASYMLFAAILDLGLIPFFAFSAVLANNDYQRNEYGWSTLFGNDDFSYKIIFAFFLMSATEGGLMAISLVIDIYLAIVFRKIAKMPPDMNPLEDNLTARPNGKRHKRNKSSLNFEKHLSGSTLATQRLSQLKEDSPSSFKRVPFVHTRTDSADSITLYGNEKALNSRISLRNEMDEINNDPYRASMVSNRETPSPSRPTTAIMPAVGARAPGAGLSHKPVRSSGLAQSEKKRPASWLSYNDYEGVPSVLSEEANRQLDHEVRPLSPVSALSDDEPMDYAQAERQNWYQGSPHHSFQRSPTQLPLTQHNLSSHSLEQEQNYNDSLIPAPHHPRKRSRDPLGMNPPTPVQDRFEDENEYYTPVQKFSTPQRPILQEVQTHSSARPGMGSRPSSFVGSGGKARYYGNLRDSLGASPTRDLFEPPIKSGVQDDEAGDHSWMRTRTRTMESEDSGNFKVYESDEEVSEEEDDQLQLQQDERNYQDLLYQRVDDIMLGIPQGQTSWNGERKISNSTGLDLKTGYAGLGAEFGRGMARRREVSGKVAEEGRGGTGYGHIGASEVQDGAVVTGQGVRGGAAGWARFHGL